MTTSMYRLPVFFQTTFYSVLLAIMLNACSGGISGTGDGGGIIVVEGDGNSATPSDTNNPDPIDTAVANLQVFPGTLFNQPLLSHNNLSNTASEDSGGAQTMPMQAATVTDQLGLQIADYRRVSDSIVNDITLLELQLIDNFNTCETVGVCSSVPINVAITDNNRQSFSNVVFSQGTTGYFDNQFSYTRENGTNVNLQWNTAQTLLYFYIDNAATTTYSLTDSQQSSITFRHINKTAPALLQARLTTHADSSTSFEADIVDWYIRGRSNSQNTIVYALDNNTPQTRREAIAEDGTVISAQRCNRDACSWLSESGDNTNAVFNNTEDNIGDFSQTLTDNDVLPGNNAIARIVIATEDINATPNIESIVCGGVNVLERQRTFCWQPLPLSDTTALVYEEYYSSGITGYLHIPAR